MNPKHYITAAELAREWGVHPQRVSLLIKQGRIKSFMVFGSRLVKRNVKRPENLKLGRPKNTGVVMAIENEKLRREYFYQLLALAKKELPELFAGINACEETLFRAMSGGVQWGFKIDGTIELIIALGTKEENEELYDGLESKKDKIKFAGNLEWDRSSDKKSCRITNTYSSDGYLVKQVQEKMVNGMSRLHEAFRPHIEELKHT